uniref:Uncharacterized protein n=1 Tax=Meloidogyne enterolobii TaxID=390850 RepID=A0A6V7XC70_MELEN|nr:unnamed protein product [Meloidogyne enterolobii]
MQQIPFFLFLVCFFLYYNEVNSVSLEFCNLVDEGKQASIETTVCDRRTTLAKIDFCCKNQKNQICACLKRQNFQTRSGAGSGTCINAVNNWFYCN